MSSAGPSQGAAAAPQRIALSLISHTNAGKTALARTLLGRDVGEVRDAAHVTTEANQYTMIESAQGDVLCLWDTPGFGDSARLARRLAGVDHPIVRFLAAAWDRWRERPLWSSQQAIRNVREDTDVVLYLVNASESPGDAGHVAPELQILEWIGKPVIVLLNQTGPPRPSADEEADEARWRQALGPRPFIHGLLTLDAFARCWVQEGTLLRMVARALPADREAGFARLTAAWQAARSARFEAAMAAIAAPIARAACDRATLPDSGLRESLRDVGRAIGLATIAGEGAKEAAMRTLARRLDADIRASTDQLIAIHQLEGRAAAEVIARLSDDVVADNPVSEGKAAIVGGFVSGALTGLAADLASGGLTFGAGLLAGGVLGAAGAAGLARGFNLVRGRTESVVRWSDEFLAALVPAAVLRYLAVAHYGRGRGEWTPSEHPAFWRDTVKAEIAQRGGVPATLWSGRGERCDADTLALRLTASLEDLARSVLDTLYPAA